MIVIKYNPNFQSMRDIDVELYCKRHLTTCDHCIANGNNLLTDDYICEYSNQLVLDQFRVLLRTDEYKNLLQYVKWMSEDKELHFNDDMRLPNEEWDLLPCLHEKLLSQLV